MHRFVALAVAVALLTIAPVVPGRAAISAEKSWDVKLSLAERPAGRCEITATGKNVSGDVLYDCGCKIEIETSGGAYIEPVSQGWITLGDVGNGRSVSYTFVVHDPNAEGFRYSVHFRGNTGPVPG
jgi:hypothetical protein